MATGRRRAATGGLAMAGLALAMAPPATAQLCPPAADPCIVASSVTVDSGTVIDVGARAFVLASGVTLTVRAAGVLALHARTIDLETGARIVASGAGGLGGDVTLLGTDGVTLAADTLVDVSAAAGGRVAIAAPAGAVRLDGEVRAFATSRDGDGGTIEIAALQACELTAPGSLRASGGDRLSLGGDVDFDCGGDVHVAGAIQSKGGDGGDVQLFAGAGVLVQPTATLDLSGRNGGEGGPLIVLAGTFIEFHGALVSRGSTLLELAGDGGDLDLVSGTAHVLLAGTIDLGGAPPDGGGGIAIIDAATDCEMSGSLTAVAAADGTGGVVGIGAADDVVLSGSIDLADGFLGGELHVVAGRGVRIAGAVAVDGAEIGGDVRIEGCDVSLDTSGTVTNLGRAIGVLASNRLVAHGELHVDGTLLAGAANELRHRDVPPVIAPGATIVPAPTIVLDPTLLCCDCGTSTTTVPPTTTTTLAATTTTSSTTATSVSSTTTSTTTVTSTSASTLPSTTATTTSSTSTSSTAPEGREVCGNCLDDDGDGRVDLADDDCCAAPAPGLLRRGRIRPRRTTNVITLISQWSAEQTVPAAPTQIQLLDGSGATRLCGVLPGAMLLETRRKTTFRDRTGLVADGVRQLTIKALRDGSTRLIVRARHDAPVTDDGMLELRHAGSAGICGATTAALRPVTRGYRAP